MLHKFIIVLILAAFISTLLSPIPSAQADNLLDLPEPGIMVDLSPAYEPMLIKGLKIHPENPFLFDFIVDTGDKQAQVDLKPEIEKLVKYFLAAITIPEKDLWVNLSPFEKNRMIAKNLAQTVMGRDMLAQDYILKQLTASLIYPEKELGKTFWDDVYTKARQLYGTTQIPVDTFNKVWIVADKADIYEHNNVAYVVGAHLKVMLEEDYLALNKHNAGTSDKSHSVASQVVRQVILPEIENEVNTGKNFSLLRQMFYSMILASWYKMALKNAILSQVYGDQSKVKVGINQADPKTNEAIFDRYLQAYKKGVFNYIKEDIDKSSGETIPRKYFSGGEDLEMLKDVVHIVPFASAAMISRPDHRIVDAKVNTKPVGLSGMDVVKFALMANEKAGILIRRERIRKNAQRRNQVASVNPAMKAVKSKVMSGRDHFLGKFPSMKKIPHEPKLDVRVKGIPVDRLDEFLGMLETGNFTESLTQALKREFLEEAGYLFDGLPLSLQGKIDPGNIRVTYRLAGDKKDILRISYYFIVPLTHQEQLMAIARMGKKAVGLNKQFISKASNGDVPIVFDETTGIIDRRLVGKQNILTRNTWELFEAVPLSSLRNKMKKLKNIQIKQGVFFDMSLNLDGRDYNIYQVTNEGIKSYGGAVQWKKIVTRISRQAKASFQGNSIATARALVPSPRNRSKTVPSIGWIPPRKPTQIPESPAMVVPPPGGIDLNASKMRLGIQRDGQGVDMHLDRAMIERIKTQGFDGMEFNIQSIMPISNLPLLLGLVSHKDLQVLN